MISESNLNGKENKMSDKPPTTESLESARKIAERMREARQYPAALPALTIQANPSHVLIEKQSFQIHFGDKEAQGFLTVKDGKLHFDGDLDESAKLFFEHVCKHAINYEKGFHEGYFEGHETGYQAGLRKAADELNKP